MHGIPEELRHRLAPKMKHSQIRALFSMSSEELNQAMDSQFKRLVEKSKVTDKAALAYLVFAPLLMENEAISKYVESSGNSSLRMVLPEVTDVKEALMLATREYQLTEQELKQLYRLLKPLDPTLAA